MAVTDVIAVLVVVTSLHRLQLQSAQSLTLTRSTFTMPLVYTRTTPLFRYSSNNPYQHIPLIEYRGDDSLSGCFLMDCKVHCRSTHSLIETVSVLDWEGVTRISAAWWKSLPNLTNLKRSFTSTFHPSTSPTSGFPCLCPRIPHCNYRKLPDNHSGNFGPDRNKSLAYK